MHIKINVDGDRNTPSRKKETGGDFQAMVQASVEQCMGILDKKDER